MNSLHWILGVGAGVIAFLSNFPYWKAIRRGTTRPSRISQFLFAVIGVATFVGMLQVGAGAGAILPGIFIIGNVITLAMAFRHGADASSKITYLVTLCAISAFVLWFIEGPHWAIAMAALANFSSYAELWLKQRQFPNSENVPSWVMTVIASVFSLVAIVVLPVPHWVVIVPPCLTIVCGGIVCLIGMRQSRADPLHA